MLNKLLNIFRIPDLRNKLLFTISLLCVYRIGFYVPLPGVNAPKIRAELMESAGDTSAMAVLSNYLSVFSGGDLTTGTMFGLGIMPYISASIMIQLMGTVVPALEKLKKEGEPGIRKINEWTRYLAVIVCLIQSTMFVWHFNLQDSRANLYTAAATEHFYLFMVLSVAALTAGSIFLMWLGEQIDHFGIGNGVSMIIAAGIISRMPLAIQDVLGQFSFSGQGDKPIGIGHVLFLVVCFVFVVGAAIFLTQAQRRIPIQQAKHMRGRRVYGGAKQYLPLRVNHAGVMPIIFASTLAVFPVWGFTYLAGAARQGAAPGQETWWQTFTGFLARAFNNGQYLHEVFFCVMIFFFAYFWNTVQFQPKEMANQLRDYGSFIPGLRPGKRTADYLENVMTRITYVGASFLCVIAIIPSVVATFLLQDMGNKAWQVSQFLGGTGLLIVISVMLDFINRIEANLVMRNYGGFMDDEGGAPARIKRPKSGPARGPTQPANAFDTGKGLPA